MRSNFFVIRLDSNRHTLQSIDTLCFAIKDDLLLENVEDNIDKKQEYESVSDIQTR